MDWKKNQTRPDVPIHAKMREEPAECREDKMHEEELYKAWHTNAVIREKYSRVEFEVKVMVTGKNGAG